jgi:hypothetical protein
MADPEGIPESLAAELVAARDDFRTVLATLEVPQLNARRLVGEWGLREIVAHLGYWAGHAAEAIHHAEQRRTDEFGDPELDVEERNATVARVARETDLATVSAREEAAYAALLDRIRRMDPGWLDERVAYGDSIEQVIRDDGADHYRGHAQEIRDAMAAAGAAGG